MSYDYSENILVQESAGHLLQNELGWEVAFAYNTEQLGENGSFGRKSYKEILLIRYFREALLRLNPWITPAQMDEAQRKLEHRLSTASLLQINEEKYFLIRDGIPVTVKKPGGKTEEKRAVVIDFQNPGNNGSAIRNRQMPLCVNSSVQSIRNTTAKNTPWQSFSPARKICMSRPISSCSTIETVRQSWKRNSRHR